MSDPRPACIPPAVARELLQRDSSTKVIASFHAKLGMVTFLAALRSVSLSANYSSQNKQPRRPLGEALTSLQKTAGSEVVQSQQSRRGRVRLSKAMSPVRPC